jgi:hypothetical protein
MIRLARPALLALLIAGAGGCERAPVHSIIYYDLALLAASGADDHYQQFAELNGGVVDLGCLVVQRRQLNCFDNEGTGDPNLRLAVVECECPCVAQEPDPCDADRGMVRTGEVRGLVNESEGPFVLGGVEIATEIELADATGIFFTREPNDDPSPQPSADVILGAALERDGAVLHGELVSPTRQPVQGTVSILPVRDEVSL